MRAFISRKGEHKLTEHAYVEPYEDVRDVAPREARWLGATGELEVVYAIAGNVRPLRSTIKVVRHSVGPHHTGESSS